jgi:hypothetical protein
MVGSQTRGLEARSAHAVRSGRFLTETPLRMVANCTRIALGARLSSAASASAARVREPPARRVAVDTA